MPIHELAALGAAACWALTGLLAARPVAEVGPFAFNLYRQCFVTLVLGGLVLLSGAWKGTDPALLPGDAGARAAIRAVGVCAAMMRASAG